MKQNEVCTTFDNQYCINGVHCTIEKAQSLLNVQEYENIKVVDVEHKWATWGRLPEEFCEPTITHGWWVVPKDSGYRHLKKMTFIITEESKMTESAIQRRWKERRERYKKELNK